jgi:hypothetical protein
LAAVGVTQPPPSSLSPLAQQPVVHDAPHEQLVPLQSSPGAQTVQATPPVPQALPASPDSQTPLSSQQPRGQVIGPQGATSASTSAPPSSGPPGPVSPELEPPSEPGGMPPSTDASTPASIWKSPRMLRQPPRPTVDSDRSAIASHNGRHMGLQSRRHTIIGPLRVARSVSPRIKRCRRRRHSMGRRRP